MKTTNQIFAIVLAFFFVMAANLSAQTTARVQVIHNSADAAAQTVDVWANDAKLIPDFAFRTATPFVDIPAKVDITIAIQPAGSTSPENPVFSTVINLDPEATYIVVANGLINQQGYKPFKPFNLYIYDMAKEAASSPGMNEIMSFHGSTDAPAVRIRVKGDDNPFTSPVVSYGEFVRHIEVPVRDYVIELFNAVNRVPIVEYAVPMASAGISGQAVTLLASGFVNPGENRQGPAFGLYIALPTGGELIPLTAVIPTDPNNSPIATTSNSTARMQIIHNSADAAAEVVDVWLNNTKLIENFAFRTATPFIDAPAGVLLNIGIAPPNSTSWTQSFSIKQVVLTENQTYLAVASGIISTSGYNPSPYFRVSVYPVGRELASQPGNTDVLISHGSTDAPTVDIYETGIGLGMIVNDLVYRNIAGYLEIPTDDYILEVRDETGTLTVAAYQAPLAALGLDGQAISVMASGFLNPANNSDGPAFGLYVALAEGGDLIPLPLAERSNARLQIIHNSADEAAEVVDVWLNNTKLIENFEFRTATPFIDAPAGVLLNIGIAPPNSTSWTQSFSIKQVVLTENQTYLAIANGIVSTFGYNPSPSFDLSIYPEGREVASQTGNTDVLVFHGSTDAPTVSVWETGVGAGELFTFSYGEYSGYLELPTEDYILEVRDVTGTVTVAAYQAPLATLGLDGQAISVMASGFLNPANNSNGPAFGLWVALASGGDLVELPLVTDPMARLQVIHNSADAAAAVVDVWANDVKLIENFEFRTATPFIDVAAETSITISITGPGSSSPTPNVFSADVTFADGETYIVVANGIVSGSGYSPATPFNLYIYDMGREQANVATDTDVLVFHGSTDAPTVSVWETGVGAGELFTFSYGEYAGYLELPTDNYILEVRDETGTVTVAAYQAPLAALGLDGQAISVMASGFLNPANNSDGPAFGLFVALAGGGELVELPLVTPTARLQVIHNSADAAAAVVDVWANDVKLIENFEFRNATPFIDVAAETSITISITGPGSSSPTPNVFSADVTFADGETYIVVANGIVSGSGYNPATPFNLYVYDMGREQAIEAENTDVLVFHGSTDAPTVSVWETYAGAGELFTFSYGEFAGYLELPTDTYILEVRDETGTVTVASYVAPLATLGLNGEAISIMASGFLNPANNSNGAAFGLWVALASGGELVELPLYEGPVARMQVIHNSADAAAAIVDVWANDVKLIENFEFRTATPFIDVAAETDITISITGPGSTSPTPNVFETVVNLDNFATYIIVANGIVSGSGYNPATPFNLYIYDMARENANATGNTDVLVYHGSTDAPTVSIWETGVGAGELFTFSYGEFAGYLELPTTDYILEVRDASGTTTIAMYHAPLGELGLSGEAITVVASGFLNPGANSGGPAFGLWVALTSGGDLVELPSTTTGLESISSIETMAVFPNPARNFVSLNMNLNNPANVTVEMIDLLGKTINTINLGWQNSINNYRIDVSNVSDGIYFLKVNTGSKSYIEKLMISR